MRWFYNKAHNLWDTENCEMNGILRTVSNHGNLDPSSFSCLGWHLFTPASPCKPTAGKQPRRSFSLASPGSGWEALACGLTASPTWEAYPTRAACLPSTFREMLPGVTSSLWAKRCMYLRLKDKV